MNADDYDLTKYPSPITSWINLQTRMNQAIGIRRRTPENPTRHTGSPHIRMAPALVPSVVRVVKRLGHTQRKGHPMKIKSLMVPRPITVTIKKTVPEALELMKLNSIRHLPVVDDQKNLKGLLTLADLKQALIPSMIGDLTLADMMIKNPVTISPESDLEIAAQLIYKHKIGGLPVTEGKKLVGIITDSDLLRTFIDMMGILSSSARIDVTTGEGTGGLNRAIQIIHRLGGDIINVGTTAQRTSNRTYYFRLTPCDTRPIKKALEHGGFIVQTEMA
jgi:acetoin utilization protein AcuB